MSPKAYLPLDPPPADEPRWKKDERERRHREFMEMGTWAEFGRKHFQEGLWGRLNLALTWVGAVVGFGYGVSRGSPLVFPFLFTVGFTTAVGALLGMFALSLLVAGLTLGAVGGVIWILLQGAALFL